MIRLVLIIPAIVLATILYHTHKARQSPCDYGYSETTWPGGAVTCSLGVTR